jgi:hypothetical protein
MLKRSGEGNSGRTTGGRHHVGKGAGHRGSMAALHSGANCRVGVLLRNNLIDRGDTTREVLHACSQPDSVDSWDEVKNVSHFRYGYIWYSMENVHVEQWVYNFGSSRFIRILRFDNGILKHIESGNYGFPK